jgi:hypothetical protein
VSTCGRAKAAAVVARKRRREMAVGDFMGLILLNTEHRTLNIQHRIWDRPLNAKPTQMAALSDLQRWKFDVHCSMFGLNVR